MLKKLREKSNYSKQCIGICILIVILVFTTELLCLNQFSFIKILHITNGILLLSLLFYIIFFLKEKENSTKLFIYGTCLAGGILVLLFCRFFIFYIFSYFKIEYFHFDMSSKFKYPNLIYSIAPEDWFVNIYFIIIVLFFMWNIKHLINELVKQNKFKVYKKVFKLEKSDKFIINIEFIILFVNIINTSIYLLSNGLADNLLFSFVYSLKNLNFATFIISTFIFIITYTQYQYKVSIRTLEIIHLILLILLCGNTIFAVIGMLGKQSCFASIYQFENFLKLIILLLSVLLMCLIVRKLRRLKYD